MALKFLIGFGFRWRRKVWVRGLERGRKQVRKKEKRERRERPVKEKRKKKEESGEMEKTTEREREREREDILIEKYYIIIIFIRFELQ